MSDRTFRANDVVSCVDEGEDGAMLYNPDKDDTVLLNPTGRAVWTMLEAPKTLDQLARALVESWPELALEQARYQIAFRRDLAELVDRLADS